LQPTGVAVVARNFTHRTTAGTASNLSYSNLDLAFNAGAVTSGAFGGTLFAPDVPNFTLEYRREVGGDANQVWQTIVRRGQLGAIAGNITGLAFLPAASGVHYDESLEIRMARATPGYALSPTFAANLTNPTTAFAVAHHSWHLAAGEWAEVGLQRPFAYDGQSDVVIEVRATGNHLGAAGGFRSGGVPMPRVHASGFARGSPPATGTVDDLGLRLRLAFDCASAAEFGTACGLLRAGHQGSPVRGTTLTFTLANAVPNSGAFLAAGFGNGAPYPMDLGQYGLRNCVLWHDVVTTVFRLTSAGGTSQHPFALPNVVDVVGIQLLAQWFQPDAAQPGGITASGYTRVLIGNQDP
jgi:hypothetical protein